MVIHNPLRQSQHQRKHQGHYPLRLHIRQACGWLVRCRRKGSRNDPELAIHIPSQLWLSHRLRRICQGRALAAPKSRAELQSAVREELHRALARGRWRHSWCLRMENCPLAIHNPQCQTRPLGRRRQSVSLPARHRRFRRLALYDHGACKRRSRFPQDEGRPRHRYLAKMNIRTPG